MKNTKILACLLATSIAIGGYGAINSAYAADADNTQVIMSSDQDRPFAPPPDGKPPMGPPPTGSAHHGAPPNAAPPNGMPGGFGGHGSMSEVKYSAST